MGCGNTKQPATPEIPQTNEEPLKLKQQPVSNQKIEEQKLWKQESLEMRLLQPTDDEDGILLLTPTVPSEVKTFQIGDRVHLRGYIGTVKFVGATELGQGNWIGIETDKEIAQGHDGSYDGMQYFLCHPKRGVFARSSLVVILDENDQNYSNVASQISVRTIITIQKNIRGYLKRIQRKKLELGVDIERRIDRFVRKTPESETTDVKRLSRCLTEPWEGVQRSKAFAIYRWITLHITFDFSGHFGTDVAKACDAESVLENRAAISLGYANLFEALCTASNIPTRVVQGVVKSYGYKLGEKILERRGRHVWNVVRVSGEWFVCDTALGAGFVADDLMFHKMPNVERFMVEPKVAITDHFPDDEKWQFLEKIVSWDEFEFLAVPTSTMYAKGVRLDSHKKCYYDIDTDHITMHFLSKKANILKGFVKDANGKSLGPRSLVETVSRSTGKIKLHALFPRPGDYLLQVCVLGFQGEWKVGVEYKIHTSDGIGFNTSGFPSLGTKFYTLGFELDKPLQNIETDNGRAVITLRCLNKKYTMKLKPKLARLSLVPGSEDLKEDVQDTSMFFVEKKADAHKIKVHVPQMGSYKLDIYVEILEKQRVEYVCTYFINAYSGASPVAGFPQISESFKSRRIQFVDQRENIQAQDGKASITLKHPENLSLEAVLKSGEDNLSDMCFTEKYNSENKESTVQVHMPDAGVFKVEIFGRREGEKNPDFLCSYVIKSLKAASENPGFPKVSDAFKSWGLKLVEPLQNITTRNGRTVITMVVPSNVSILGKLFGEDAKNIAGMCRTKDFDDGREVAVNTPTPGTFKLSIYGRRGKKSKKTLLCSFRLKSLSAASENPGFPKLTEMFSAWNLKLVDQFENISTETGRTSITLDTPGSLLLTARLKQNEQELPTDLCFAERNGTQMKISAHLPEAGLYDLSISGQEGPGSKLELLGSYSVFSCRGLGERAGFPHLDEEFRLWGLRLDSNKENISVYDGSVVITFLNPNKVELRAELLDEHEEDLASSVSEEEMDERMVYHCTLPKKGKYSFNLHGSNVTGSENKKLLCSYKIFY